MTKAWDDLLPRLRDLTDLLSTSALLSWDQQVLMPRATTGHRARMMATIDSLIHERLTDPGLGDLISTLEADDSLDDAQKASVRLLRRDHDKAVKVPLALVRELSELQGRCFRSWAEARAASDFEILQPDLERMFELKKQQADAVGYEGERYDALLDDFEPGLTARDVEKLFRDLVTELKPLADAILQRSGDRPEFMSRPFDDRGQEDFSQWLIGVMKFDTSRGRLDQSPHPFTSRMGADDVRQTTRILTNDFVSNLRSTMHETGHALYEQGLPVEWADLPIGNTRSLGLHESQSRIWEIQVGTGRAFLGFLFDEMKSRWPEQLGDVSADDFYRGVNHPHRSPIRVEADEVTYNLHVALRAELELALFREELAVADLPEAWDAGMEKHVGIRPESQADGVLQDIHWSGGLIGYFPTYTMGTLYAAAFYERAVADLGDPSDDLARGHVGKVLDWLRTNLHSYGSTEEPRAAGERIIGGPLTVTPFIEHIRTKYAAIYGALD
ncbi:MAG TPA: carboxypeptidase M32 [Actinomycetota bacterium]|nr:carboxypeptidase M32 [Actinomycetota bacterium]